MYSDTDLDDEDFDEDEGSIRSEKEAVIEAKSDVGDSFYNQKQSDN